MTSALIAPPIDLLRCVRAYYWHDVRADQDGKILDRQTRIPPNPYVALVWLVSGSAILIECAGQVVADPLPECFLAGAHRHPYRSLAAPSYQSFGIAFHPAAFGLLTGCAMAATADRIHPAHTILPRDWWDWSDAMRCMPHHQDRIALANEFLSPRWQAIAHDYPHWLDVIRHRWHHHVLIRMARWIGWGQRQLQRRSLSLVGLPSGEVERLLRLEQALLALRAGESKAAIAADHGYADQPHFTRAVRRYYQSSPGQLLRQTRDHTVAEDWLLTLVEQPAAAPDYDDRPAAPSNRSNAR